MSRGDATRRIMGSQKSWNDVIPVKRRNRTRYTIRNTEQDCRDAVWKAIQTNVDKDWTYNDLCKSTPDSFYARHIRVGCNILVRVGLIVQVGRGRKHEYRESVSYEAQKQIDDFRYQEARLMFEKASEESLARLREDCKEAVQYREEESKKRLAELNRINPCPCCGYQYVEMPKIRKRRERTYCPECKNRLQLQVYYHKLGTRIEWKEDS